MELLPFKSFGRAVVGSYFSTSSTYSGQVYTTYLERYNYLAQGREAVQLY